MDIKTLIFVIILASCKGQNNNNQTSAQSSDITAQKTVQNQQLQLSESEVALNELHEALKTYQLSDRYTNPQDDRDVMYKNVTDMMMDISAESLDELLADQAFSRGIAKGAEIVTVLSTKPDSEGLGLTGGLVNYAAIGVATKEKDDTESDDDEKDLGGARNFIGISAIVLGGIFLPVMAYGGYKAWKVMDKVQKVDLIVKGGLFAGLIGMGAYFLTTDEDDGPGPAIALASMFGVVTAIPVTNSLIVLLRSKKVAEDYLFGLTVKDLKKQGFKGDLIGEANRLMDEAFDNAITEKSLANATWNSEAPMAERLRAAYNSDQFTAVTKQARNRAIRKNFVSFMAPLAFFSAMVTAVGVGYADELGLAGSAYPDTAINRFLGKMAKLEKNR